MTGGTQPGPGGTQPGAGGSEPEKSGADAAPDTSRAGDIARYSFLRVFANDGTIDAAELAYMTRLAEEDGHVDDHERRALARIFERVTEDTVDPDVWAGIQRFCARYDIQ